MQTGKSVRDFPVFFVLEFFRGISVRQDRGQWSSEKLFSVDDDFEPKFFVDRKAVFVGIDEQIPSQRTNIGKPDRDWLPFIKETESAIAKMRKYLHGLLDMRS